MKKTKCINMKKTNSITAICLSAILLFGVSCKSLTNTQKGAAIGTAGGAAAGAAVGKAAGNTALGAIIGAAVGGTAGVLIGKKMDKQADEIKKQVPDAQVERKGEGIIVTFNSNVLFGFDKYQLTDASRATVQKLATVLNTYPDENVLVIGHTDNTGSASYNMDLSQKRAQSVADYLSTLGIASARISTKGMGETDPKVPNDTEAHRAENRRVEFAITASQEMKNQAKEQAQQQ